MRLISAFLVASLAACSNSEVDTNDPNPPAQVAGTFTGSYTNLRNPGTYTATLTLTQIGNTVSGTFRSTDNNLTAAVTGTVTDVKINATFQTSGTCAMATTAVIDIVQSATTLLGTYTTQDCIGAYSGAMSLTKQP